MTYTKACTRRLIHLPKHHYHLVEHTGFFHIMVQLMSFTAALSNATKHTHAIVMSNHVMNHFCKQNCFAYTGSAEQPGFSATFQWYKYIDGFNTCYENFSLH